MTACRKPDVVTRQLKTGRWVSWCLTCREHSNPTTHKPIAEAWRRDHNRATRPTTDRRWTA